MEVHVSQCVLNKHGTDFASSFLQHLYQPLTLVLNTFPIIAPRLLYKQACG
jgi:hypothetical protein